jgi:hypothetical protein
MLIIIIAALIITYGNYLGEKTPAEPEPVSASTRLIENHTQIQDFIQRNIHHETS